MNRIQEPGVSVPKSYKGIYLAFFKLSFLKAQFTQMYRNFLKKGVVSALFNFFFSLNTIHTVKISRLSFTLQ